jgi:hypothetical protein
MTNINKQTVKELATRLKVDEAKLSAELLTDVADESKQTTKVGDLLNGMEVLSSTEKDTLLSNHGKTKYDSGAVAAKEIMAKEISKSFGLDPNDPSHKDMNVLVNKILEQEKKKNGTEPDKRVTELEKEKGNLQKSVINLTAEIETLKTKVSESHNTATIRSSVSAAIANIQFDADEAKLPAQREILQMAFEKKHEVKIEEGKAVVYRDGKKLVDSLQNPLTVEQAMKDFAPLYVNLKTKTGRGDSSSSNNSLSGDLASITDKNSLAKYLTDKNIRFDSQEAMAVLKEVREKNPAFKLN